MRFSRLAAAAAFATAAMFGTTANATIFQADYDSIWSSYDAENQVYGAKFNTDGGAKDGFWLVVSDGPNPKTNVDEYAILYGDLDANRITAYVYDGENSANSYRDGQYLATFDGAISDAGNGMSMFNIDVAGINAALAGEDWDGVVQGEQSGIWFHRSAGSSFEYGADGQLLDYAFNDQMFTDRAFKDSFVLVSPNCSGGGSGGNGFIDSCNPTPGTGPNGSVPAPGGLALLLAGLAGIGVMRRRR